MKNLLFDPSRAVWLLWSFHHQVKMSTTTAPTTAKLTKKQLKAEQWRKKNKSGGAEDGREVKKGKGRSPRSIAKEKKMLKAKELAEKAAREAANGEVAIDEPAAETSVVKVKKVKQDKKSKLSVNEASSVEKKQEEKASGSDKRKSKRKREEEAEAEPVKRTKKHFTEEGKVEEIEVKETVAATKEEEEKRDDRRFIVFVGNMSYQSTAEEIAKHFLSHCGEKPSVRLLTSKGDPSKLAQLSKAKQKSIAKGKASDPSAPTSKGCAFLEFETATALQKALQFHHTQFQGRNINVELTAGGGGKGSERKEKIKKKNQDLEVERQKLHEKYVKGQKKDRRDDDSKAEEPKKEQLPAWGPRASSSAKNKGTTKIPRWAASGSNAVRLSA